MNLKQYLRKSIKSRIKELQDQLAQNKEGLEILQGMNIGKATYTVYLESLWADYGEKSITLEHRGCLEEAIEKAEERFKTTNERSDVQADCFVEINLGDSRYEVPEEFWKQYREKLRQLHLDEMVKKEKSLGWIL